MSDPTTKSQSLLDMQQHHSMLDALRGGTAKMRAAAEKFLPRNPAESMEAYRRRLNCAVLLPIYERTLGGLIGKPFKEPIRTNDDVPPTILELLDDADQEGSNLTVFMREVAMEALDKGISYILVDYPSVESGLLTEADERAMGLRPYAVHIKPSSVCGIGSRKIQGRNVLTEFRYHEKEVVSNPDFTQTTIERVRVLRPESWEVWTKAQNGDWFLQSTGTNTSGIVPVVPLYSKRTGFYMGEPGLLEVAFLNIAHWQSRSEQQNILHVARVPILTIFGGEEEKDIAIGTSSVTTFTSPDARMEYVEHSGRAIDAGDRDLKNIQEEATSAGADMNIVRPGRYTATQVGIEDENNLSPLQAFALAIQDAANNVLQIMARWMRLSDGGSVKVFTDFAGMDEGTIEWLRLLYESGAISAETLLKEAQRHGVVDDTVEFSRERDAQDVAAPEFAVEPQQREAILKIVGR